MYYRRNIERNKQIYFDYFRTELSSKQIAEKYGLSIQTIHTVIKDGQRGKKMKPPTKRVIFKGRIYKSTETLAKKLGIKRESVVKAIRCGFKYERRYTIQYYKKAG